MADSLVKPKRKAPPKKAAKSAEGFTCDYCHKTFIREGYFLNHLCEPKRRWMDRDLQHVKLGFKVFQRFHEMNYRGRKERTFEEFIRSQLYGGFVRFGRYLLNINAVRPEKFIDFLIGTGVKIDKWESPVVYETYIRELNKEESPDAAVERNILLMQQWAMTTGEEWVDFFRKVSPAQATLWIQTGRISPWVLFTASSAQQLLDRMSPEQVELVYKYIDPRFWEIMIKRKKEDVEEIRTILDEAGL